MNGKYRHISRILLCTTCLIALLGISASVSAQSYYEVYSDQYVGYVAYESNVQDAFAASAPSTSAPKSIKGRQNMWGGDGYGEDENLHPGDPLPLGDHGVLFIFAAITAMIVFIQQRKRKHASSANQRLLTLAACIIATSTALAQNEGDYRIKYVEQTATSYTNIKIDYAICSDIIPASATPVQDTVSLHIYNQYKQTGTEIFNGINNPEVILQCYEAGEWVDKECYMVFGPLQLKSGGVIKLPGRKNASDGSSLDDFVHDTGIPTIIHDTEDHACGVWNFVVVQDGTVAHIDMDQVHRYRGNYYIRTASAEGGYDNYTLPGNLLHYYEYAYTNYGTTHDFTHSYCSKIPADGAVKFTVACDYSTKLAHDLLLSNDRFADDAYATDVYVKEVAGEPALPSLATVRFGWDKITNRLTRAYIAETRPQLTNEYLVIEGDISHADTKYPGYFYDNTNWVYSVDIQSQPGALAKVKALYNGSYQYFWGNATTGAALLEGSDTTAYPVRIIYDFKEHRFSTIYNPNSKITGEINLQTPVMILREHNGPATQITFATNDDKIKAKGTTGSIYTQPAYAVLTFLEDKFATNVTTTNHYEKMFYWVSFPFDIAINDIFGLGEYGGYWAIQYYDGPKRAMYGLANGSTGWEYMPADGTLKANVGYVVCLNYRRLTTDYGYAEGGGRKVSLYFPSASKVSPADIQNCEDITVSLAEHPKGEKITWSHWNWHLLGVPSFADVQQSDITFYYEYWHPGDAYGPSVVSEMRAMHAYMVQYAGDIKWSGIVNIAPSGLAAKKNSSTIDKTMLRLELQQAGETMDKTFVQLREEEGTEGFDLNLDLTKIINKGANIYTVVNGDQMAGNVVPAEESIIPLGVVIAQAGEYRFAMPSSSNGVTIELIDNEKGASTNLLALDYVIALPAGTFESRFALSIQPDKVSTDLENGEASISNDNVRKLLIDGTLYLLKDGSIYDAQGRCVK